MTTSQQKLQQKFETRSARIAVLGMGYVGLPLAVVFAQAGFEVIGIDPDESKIEAINNKRSYIGDVSNQEVARLVDAAFNLVPAGPAARARVFARFHCTGAG